MSTRDVIVVGASAGGVEALRTLVSRLPADLPASVLIVLHVPSSGTSALPQILARATSLDVRHAEHGDALLPGVVLVAPPDRHLAVVDGHVVLTAGPRENGHRPAVDVLFRSAARAAGPRVIGVVLSGTLDDGAAGLASIVARGGEAVVQDPDDALYAGMPLHAIDAAAPRHVVPVTQVAQVVSTLARQQVSPVAAAPTPLMDVEVAMSTLDPGAMHDEDRPGEPSGLSCPDCHGTLFTVEKEPLLRFRCRVGHAWSGYGLASEQSQEVEEALWMALRSLEEKAALARQMSSRALANGHVISGQRFEEQAVEAHKAAETIRAMLAATEAAISVSDEIGVVEA